MKLNNVTQPEITEEQLNAFLNCPFLIFFMIFPDTKKITNQEVNSFKSAMSSIKAHNDVFFDPVAKCIEGEEAKILNAVVEAGLDYSKEMLDVGNEVDQFFPTHMTYGFKGSLFLLAYELYKDRVKILNLNSEQQKKEQIVLGEIFQMLNLPHDDEAIFLSSLNTVSINEYFDGLKAKFNSTLPESSLSEASGLYDNLTDALFQKLSTAPLMVFFFVASADGEIDTKERNEFAKILGNLDDFSDPLLKKALLYTKDNLVEITKKLFAKPLNHIEELNAVRDVVDEYLNEAEAYNFKLGLFILGKKIADASGGFMGFGNRVSKNEEAVLAAIALTLRISIE